MSPRLLRSIWTLSLVVVLAPAVHAAESKGKTAKEPPAESSEPSEVHVTPVFDGVVSVGPVEVLTPEDSTAAQSAGNGEAREWLVQGAPIPSSAPSPGRTVGAAFALIGLMVLAGIALWMKRRLAPKGQAAVPSLRMLSSTRVGAKGQVLMAEVGGRQLLLGVTDAQISLLAWLDAESGPKAVSPPTADGVADRLLELGSDRQPDPATFRAALDVAQAQAQAAPSLDATGGPAMAGDSMRSNVVALRGESASASRRGLGARRWRDQMPVPGGEPYEAQMAALLKRRTRR